MQPLRGDEDQGALESLRLPHRYAPRDNNGLSSRAERGDLALYIKPPLNFLQESVDKTAYAKNKLDKALRLYCQLPFGQLHQRNPEVIAVANAINRTPSAVAMKACNFASLDPVIKQRGLGNVSCSDRELWDEFQQDSEVIADLAEATYQQVVVNNEIAATIEKPSGPTESIREIKTRRVQSFFRKSVLISYGNQCAINGLKISEKSCFNALNSSCF